MTGWTPQEGDLRTRWFGEPWPRADYRAPVCEDDALRVPVPEAEACMHCREPIGPDDNGTAMPGYIDTDGWHPDPLYSHRECQLRTVVGCYAKLRGLPCDHSGSYRADALKVEAYLTGVWADHA